ncbi:MAG: putative quinol monooxygenase [Peptococcaceae bacterium]
MIILHVTYTAKPGQKENYLKAVAAAGIDAASRAEAGNVRYDYFYAAQQENTILLVEVWETAAALEAHKATAHFQQLASIKDQYIEQTAVERFAWE